MCKPYPGSGAGQRVARIPSPAIQRTGVRRRFERSRPPILEVIAGWTEGQPPALPDEGPQDGRTIRWGAGALDGVLALHVDSAPEPARGAELAMLIEHAATGDDEARTALYEAARADGIVFALDEALDA